MRNDPLSFLSDELDALKSQGLYRRLRVLDDMQAARTDDRRPRRHQSFVEQLPGADDASPAQGESAGGDRAVRRGHRLGAHHRRHDGDSHGARAAARGVQENRGRRRVSERLRRKRRHGRGHSHQGRLRHFRRAEPREHHRRRASQPRDDQGLSASRRGRRARHRARLAGDGAQAADHRRRVQHGRRPRRAARAVRPRRGIRLHHDGRRRARERRVRKEWARHDRSFRAARPRRRSGGHAVEGHRCARRVTSPAAEA